MAILTRPAAAFPLALAVKRGQATLGEAFTFASGLYFRGKMAYASRFATPPKGAPGALVIAPGLGLVDAARKVGLPDLAAMAKVPVDPDEPRFRGPLGRDVAALAKALGKKGEAVLLGSIATGKYTDVLLEALGERLLFPKDFVGRGDLSRGGLMLRASREGRELVYVPVNGAERRGPRPARLPRISPSPAARPSRRTR